MLEEVKHYKDEKFERIEKMLKEPIEKIKHFYRIQKKFGGIEDIRDDFLAPCVPSPMWFGVGEVPKPIVSQASNEKHSHSSGNKRVAIKDNFQEELSPNRKPIRIRKHSHLLRTPYTNPTKPTKTK